MQLRAWHFAGLILFLAVVGLIGYAYWPVWMGTDAEAGERPDVEVPAAAARIEAVVMEKGEFLVYAEATGHLAPWREAQLSAEVGGVLTERLVREGQYVEAGAVLFRLDDREPRLNLAEAEAELTKIRGEYYAELVASGSISQVRDTTELQQARQVYARAEQDFSAGRIASGDLQAARQRLNALVWYTTTDPAAVRAATKGLTQAENRVERARLTLTRTDILAPFSGRIANIEVEVGQRINMGMPLLDLLDMAQMKVDVHVLEADMVYLQRGAVAQVRVPALENTVVTGRVHAINPQVDVDVGTGQVTVVIPNRDGRLLAGLSAYVDLETRRIPDQWVVPANALLSRGGRDVVFRVKNGRADWLYTTVSTRSGDYVTLTDDRLVRGDTIAVGSHFALAHDALVAPVVVNDQFVRLPKIIQ